MKEDNRLTTKSSTEILAKHGIMRRRRPEEEGTSQESRLIFKKDMREARDLAIREEVIQEIMDNRGVSREEAERIMNNPM